MYERLESIQEELTKCEKALAEYLETKRLAFPRFYFVSSADLLDILSNGNNPVAVSNFFFFLNFSLPLFFFFLFKLKKPYLLNTNIKLLSFHFYLLLFTLFSHFHFPLMDRYIIATPYPLYLYSMYSKTLGRWLKTLLILNLIYNIYLSLW